MRFIASWEKVYAENTLYRIEGTEENYAYITTSDYSALSLWKKIMTDFQEIKMKIHVREQKKSFV